MNCASVDALRSLVHVGRLTVGIFPKPNCEKLFDDPNDVRFPSAAGASDREMKRWRVWSLAFLSLKVSPNPVRDKEEGEGLFARACRRGVAQGLLVRALAGPQPIPSCESDALVPMRLVRLRTPGRAPVAV